jgi:S-formylglutathione hydrolase FrmB
MVNRLKIPILYLMLLAAPGRVNAAAIELVEVFSASMQKPVRCMVVVPEGYSTLGDRFPTVYLLHGWSGYYASWMKDAPQLPELADRYGVLIICPDGGYDSWYLDSPVNGSVRYETFLARELPNWVEYYYHAERAPDKRYIAGLSMGGHGAVRTALLYPEVYSRAASLAGGLDLRPFRQNNWSLDRVLGSPSTHWVHWEKASVAHLLDEPRAQYPDLMIDCGTADFFLEVNRDVHRKLTTMRVPHLYRERPGGHDAGYWGTAINDVFSWLFG